MNQDELFSKATLSECEILDQATQDKLKSFESKKKYTAQRLKEKKPEKYNVVVQMLSIGVPPKEIADICNLHFYTVIAVQERDPKLISQLKDKLAAKAASNAMLIQDKILSFVENLSEKDATPQKIQQLASASATLIDKASLLSGEATERVELVDKDELYNGGDVDDYFKKYTKDKDIFDI